jgi:hypothetical protein
VSALGHIDVFEVAVQLAIAVLEDGRTGLVRLSTRVDPAKPLDFAGYEMWVSGRGDPVPAPQPSGTVLHVHSGSRKAALHFLELVGIGQGAKAIRKAAMDGAGADGRWHAFSLEATLSAANDDTFSFANIVGKWTYIIRYDRDAQGTAMGGADICGPDLAKALAHWEARCQRKMAERQAAGGAP